MLRDALHAHAFRNSDQASLDAIDNRIRIAKGADLELVGRDTLALGVVFETNDIKALRRDSDAWHVECQSGPHSARRIVLAMGAWSAALLKPLGLSLPLIAERGYHI
jgi:D-amino-acid dehydrogenase